MYFFESMRKNGLRNVMNNTVALCYIKYTQLDACNEVEVACHLLRVVLYSLRIIGHFGFLAQHLNIS